MYAVIKTGGKQYRVQEGDIIDVEKISADTDKVVFSEILLVGDGDDTVIGTPFVSNASVEAKVIENGKLEKVIVYKYKAKKDYRRKQGHRQPFTRLEITSVSVKKSSARKPKKETAAEEAE